MAGFVDKFKKMWDYPDDEYEYDEYEEYEEESSDSYDDDYEQTKDRERRRSERRRSYDSYSNYEGGSKVVNINASTKIQVVLFKPERFGDETRVIADELLKNRTVVLNLEDTNKDMSRRIIDFLSGVAYAKQGKIKKIAKSTFIIMPENVDFTGDDLLDELENSGVLF
ncbi:MAG: cell division protein SepF [Oscillospiraceae bacterium]|nr:cell division protein SepF [Oscillospiraceae bacterium]